MTANLIAYWGYAEGKRHNQVTEAETERHNREMEDYNRDNLLEVVRHNKATEAETQRSNLAREIENMRHNVATETETQRHNVAYEQETYRHNLAGELETQRHNLAYEGETHRHNVVTELETERSNRADEAIRRESNQIGWANVGLGYAQLAETTRHNKAYEAYQSAALAETQLHNRLTEVNAYRNTDLGYLQSDRSYTLGLGDLYLDYQRVEETKRHNQASEQLQEYSNRTARANAWTGGIKNVAGAVSDATRAVGNIIPWFK